MKKIELALNIVVAAAIVVVAGMTVQRYLAHGRHDGHAHPGAQALVGTRMTVAGIDWRGHPKSLVFFLKKDCPACQMAAPLYRRLADEATRRDVQWLAILPEPLAEAQHYVRSLGLPADRVRSAPLSSLRIPSVPAVVVVDGAGVVQRAWLGASPDRENELRAEMLALLDARSR